MVNKKFKVVNECRICGGHNLEAYLDLGNMPLSNNLVSEEQIPLEEKFPLKVMFCKDCSFSQLSVVVNPDVLFRNYVYRSSVSSFFRAHCREFAQELNSSLLNKGDLVIDIASNDGCLLKEFNAKGNTVLGVDPAINLAKIANADGIETIADYWSPKLAGEILKTRGHAKAIIAINVFAHIADLHSMVEGVKTMLADDGYFIIESPHLQSLIEKTEFDTIYHEHLSYLLVKPLARLMEQHGLRIAKVKKQDIHGGSIRLYVEKKTKADSSDGSVEKIIREENEAGLYNFENYLRFQETVEKFRRDFVSKIRGLRRRGKRIAAFGASAKGNVLLNYCGIGRESIECIFDDTPEKQNMLYPGVHIMIVPGKELLARKPDYLILLAWNFAAEIMQKTSAYRESGGKYIIPLGSLKN